MLSILHASFEWCQSCTFLNLETGCFDREVSYKSISRCINQQIFRGFFVGNYIFSCLKLKKSSLSLRLRYRFENIFFFFTFKIWFEINLVIFFLYPPNFVDLYPHHCEFYRVLICCCCGCCSCIDCCWLVLLLLLLLAMSGII